MLTQKNEIQPALSSSLLEEILRPDQKSPLAQNGFVQIDSLPEIEELVATTKPAIAAVMMRMKEKLAAEYADFSDMALNRQEMVSFHIPILPDAIVHLLSTAKSRLEQLVGVPAFSDALAYSNYCDRARLHPHRDGEPGEKDFDYTHRFIVSLEGRGTLFVPGKFDHLRQGGIDGGQSYENGQIFRRAEQAGELVETKAGGISLHQNNLLFNGVQYAGPLHTWNLGERLIYQVNFSLPLTTVPPF